MSKENQAKAEYRVGDWVVITNKQMLGDSWLGVLLRVRDVSDHQLDSYPVACEAVDGRFMPLALDEIRPATAVEILTAKLRGSA